MTGKMVYRMFFLAYNFMSGLLCTQKPIKRTLNFFQKTSFFPALLTISGKNIAEAACKHAGTMQLLWTNAFHLTQHGFLEIQYYTCNCDAMLATN